MSSTTYTRSQIQRQQKYRSGKRLKGQEAHREVPRRLYFFSMKYPPPHMIHREGGIKTSSKHPTHRILWMKYDIPTPAASPTGVGKVVDEGPNLSSSNSAGNRVECSVSMISGATLKLSATRLCGEGRNGEREKTRQICDEASWWIERREAKKKGTRTEGRKKCKKREQVSNRLQITWVRKVNAMPGRE